MKRLLVAVMVLLSTTVAVAASEAAGSAAAKEPVSPWHFDIFPLNGELRYERDPAQQMVDRRPLNLAFGVRKSATTVLFEYSRFSETTGNDTLSLDRTHEEYVFWWKQNLLTYEVVDFFITGGAGVYNETVKTNLAGAESSTDSSGLQIMGGASGGLQTLIAHYVLVSFEGRLIAGKNFDPNPQPSLLLRVGVEF